MGLVAALVVVIGAPIVTWTLNNDVAVKTPLGANVGAFKWSAQLPRRVRKIP
jgi:hypothetical protein